MIKRLCFGHSTNSIEKNVQGITCTSQIFDSPPIMYNKTFFFLILKEVCGPHLYAFKETFESKLLNYSKHSESLNFRKHLFENSLYMMAKIRSVHTYYMLYSGRVFLLALYLSRNNFCSF